MTLSLDIELSGITRNAEILSEAGRQRSIEIVGVVKGVLSDLDCVEAMVKAGVSCLGEASPESLALIRAWARSGGAPEIARSLELMLMKQPLPDELELAVSAADVIFVWDKNAIAELDKVVERLSKGVQKVLLVVDMGYGREGVIRSQLKDTAKFIHAHRHLELTGVAITLNCDVYGQDDRSTKLLLKRNQAANEDIVRLIEEIEAEEDLHFNVISGGNSGAVDLMLAGLLPPRINQLRVGESILFGRSTVTGRLLNGLHEGNFKLRVPVLGVRYENGQSNVVLAVGKRDLGAGCAYLGPDLTWPEGTSIQALTSDHLVIRLSRTPASDELFHQVKYGSTATLYPDYYGLLGLLASGRIRKRFLDQQRRK